MARFTKEQLDILYNCMIASESDFNEQNIIENFSVNKNTAIKCINIAKANTSFWNANKWEYKHYSWDDEF